MHCAGTQGERGGIATLCSYRLFKILGEIIKILSQIQEIFLPFFKI